MPRPDVPRLDVPSHETEKIAARHDCGSAGPARPVPLRGGFSPGTGCRNQLLWSSNLPGCKTSSSLSSSVLQAVCSFFSRYPQTNDTHDAVKHTNSMHACADPVPALPEPIFPSHILGYLGSSLRGSRDLDSDVAGRNGGLALPFNKEEDRYDHNLKTGSTPPLVMQADLG